MIPCKNPCTGECPNRSATCHSECLDYVLYRSIMDRNVEARNVIKKAETEHARFVQDRIAINSRGRY